MSRKSIALYLALFGLMVLFVVNDLVFDFLFNFNTSDYISFAFTLAASIITFVCTFKITKDKISAQADKMTTFIKSNFNKWQVIFSILDIVCGIISILSGLAFLAGIFKIVKFCYLPTKFIVVTNKSKTIIKTVTRTSLIWTAGRTMLRLKKMENKEVKSEKLSKIQIASICGAVAGVIFAIVSVFVPQIAIAGDYVYNILIATGVEGICAFAGTFKGYTKRTQEEIDKIKNKQVEKQEKAIEKEALKEIKKAEKLAHQSQAEQEKNAAKAEAEAKAKAEREKAEAEYRAKVEEAKAKLLSEKK